MAVTVALSCGHLNFSKFLNMPNASSSLPSFTSVSATRPNVWASIARPSFLKSEIRISIAV
uniref:Uncharacterized protein MANES_14G081700 n=1 Tax=Rhizophora mucronata TaxID=61149 RepID=A0A2P2QL25_RHIMU